MVKIYLARQPIIDRTGKIFAYELLFRSGFKDFAEVEDSKRATAKVIESLVSSFSLKDIIRDKLGFINIDHTSDMLSIVELLPHDKIGFEILESSVLSEDFFNTLSYLKSMGYKLSLDDFIYADKFIPYLELVDYVKIDVLEHSPEQVEEFLEKIKPYDVKLIAEKVETYEIYETYYDMGFDYFQGFFFQEPRVIASKTVEPTYTALVKLYNLVAEERDVREIESVFRKFSDLSVKLLQLINSAYYALRQPVKSIRHAVLMLGYKNILRWILLLMYSVRSEEFTSDPLFEEASLRGFYMESVAKYIFSKGEIVEKSFITGVLSLVDVLLGVPMEKVVSSLSLEEDIKVALLRREGTLGDILRMVELVQTGKLSKIEPLLEKYSPKHLTVEKLLQLQMEALKAYSRLEI